MTLLANNSAAALMDDVGTGAEVAAANSYGCNAVHWAALTGNLPMCIWLSELRLPLALLNKQGCGNLASCFGTYIGAC
jgi:hypothetical protein